MSCVLRCSGRTDCWFVGRLGISCAHKGWAGDARAYHELVTAWSGIEQAANDAGVIGSQGWLDI